MLCVMIFHSCILWSGIWQPFMTPVIECSWLGLFATWLSTFHIYAFVLVSGYLYSYIRLEKKGYNDARLFVKKKAKRLLLPYLVITIFWLVPFALAYRDYTIKDYVLKYVIGGGEQLWFLYMLFWVFVLFYYLEPILRRYKFLSNILVLAIYAVGWIFNAKGINYFQISSSLQFLLLFWIGYNLRIHKEKFFSNSIISLNSWHSILLLALLNIVVFIWYVSPYAFIRPILILFLNVEGSITAFALFLLLGQKINIRNKFILCVIDNNFTMYLLHQQIIYLSISLFNGLICPPLNAILNFAISFSISLLLSLMIRKNRFSSDIFC